jgi:hypothetical protein
MRQVGRFVDFQPAGRIGNPPPHRQRSPRVGQFDLDRTRKCNPFKQSGKEFDLIDLDQIIDGTGIRYHQLHRLQSEVFEGFSFLLKIFEGVVLIYPVRLEKTVQLNPCQPQHLTQLRFSNPASPKLLKSKPLKRTP